MRLPTPHLLRVEFAHSLGRVAKLNGRHITIPLYHRRPPEPFQPRITRSEAAELDAWMRAIPSI